TSAYPRCSVASPARNDFTPVPASTTPASTRSERWYSCRARRLSTMSFSAMGAKCRVEPVELTLAQLQEMGSFGFPGLLGVEFDEASDGSMRARLELAEKHMAPTGYLHGETVVGSANPPCGYGCILNLPEGATGFTTIEL